MGYKGFWKLNTYVWVNCKKVLLLLILILPNLLLASPKDTYSFNSEKNSQQFESLIHELRCLVCQNQSIADSDAVLAKDLRQKIYVMINEGKTDKEIKSYLASRYGAFILFSPPFNWQTGLLWLFPAILLTIIAGGMALRKRKA